ncbi:MAG: hypothetical protein WBA97_36915 [Actinophytocola sp.]|uniref:hypothetical protein n=1 Tax=Actinophytocola sp. TaxID=1872138 RepID=UPI003C774138
MPARPLGETATSLDDLAAAIINNDFVERGSFAIVYGYRQFNPAVTWITVIAIVVIVQVAQFAGNLIARKILRR